MGKKPELLSPAGDWEKLQMAVLYGADAVYLAGTSFGMRSFAGNFDDEALPKAVRFAHDHGVKVHATVNTMPRWNEAEALPAHLEKLDAAGVDALILADLGAFTLAGKYAPHCQRHISTQQSIANHVCAQAWYDLGASRVVLARELDRDEVREICAGCGAEIEVFGHGALCMCYSGQCEMSAVLGQRSGNRGACAQPCRLPYGVNGPCRDMHPLSLKDANLSAYLRDMASMGVDCLKLEGRLKRPEYVAVVTGIYRRLLDEEFTCIQWHTVFGYELLCNVGGKDDLAPAALYHHTFYDGHGGYPKNYPPCPVGIKPIVDALTVADSLDAATDNIGRCYTMAKPVDTLLGEFRAQKGTRYAPEVVALLDDEEFSRDLKETLDETRKSVYLEVYHVKR